MRNTLILTLSLSSALMLAGCSEHKNQLSNPNTTKTAQFLVKASQYAEKKLKIFRAPGGEEYGQCQLGTVGLSTCNRLYTAMASYAQTTSFKGLREQDLKNNASWANLKDEYNKIQFNQI
jgi:hypothetical protein